LLSLASLIALYLLMFSAIIERMFGSLSTLVKQRQELDAAEAAWLSDVADYDRSGDWRAEGFLSAAAALRSACRMDRGVARAHVDLARKLDDLPVVAAAFADGEISGRHASAVANVYTPERAAEIGNVEAELVEFARQSTPKELAGVMKRLADAIDGDGGAVTDEHDYEGRACYLARLFNGALDLKANGDAYNAEFIETAINAEMARDLEAGDTRTTPQRRFDALTNICRLHLDHGDTGETHGVRPHVSLVIDTDELPGTGADTVGRVRAERRHNGYLSAASIELLLCDCDLSRVITSGRSEILDVGRTTPTTTPAQWKALVTRDRHCQTPGCDRPPSHCQSHHIWHWARGGTTDLDNLQLLCWNHHRERHTQEAKARASNFDP
jgi:hypothetical protein